MEITIHRGIDQIGGCITEVATAKTRILIDFGQNLPDNEGHVLDDLATKENVSKLTNGVNAIIYTHYHGDHIGLFNLVPKNIEQYLGKVAKQVVLCKHSKLRQIKGREKLSAEEIEAIQSMKTMRSGVLFSIGDIHITPYFVSHSAYESFMLLIDADGKRILHTGDFRDHGYLGKGLKKVIKTYIGQVDILITEATMLSRGDEKVRHEKKLQEELMQIMKEYKNCFIICSSTDLERLATIHAAHNSIRANAPFVCDTFQKDVLDIFTGSLGKLNSELFDFSDTVTFESRHADIRKNGFTMLVRPTAKFGIWVDKLLPTIVESQTVIVFSMWGEYINPLGRHAKKEYLDFISKFPHLRKLHTSGHASRECLANVCNLTTPRTGIIPIHSEQSAQFASLDISNELKSRIILKSTNLDYVNVIINP